MLQKELNNLESQTMGFDELSGARHDGEISAIERIIDLMNTIEAESKSK